MMQANFNRMSGFKRDIDHSYIVFIKFGPLDGRRERLDIVKLPLAAFCNKLVYDSIHSIYSFLTLQLYYKSSIFKKQDACWKSGKKLSNCDHLYNKKEGSATMKTKQIWKRAISVLLAVIIAASMLTTTAGAVQPDEQGSSFAEQFKSPEGTAKPFIRWWVSPGTMTEEGAKEQVRRMAEAGFGGLKMLCRASSIAFGSEEWAGRMRWALEEAIACGVQLYFTIGEGWPVKTPAITDPDDIRTQQGLFYKNVDFTASEGTMAYETDELPFPDRQFVVGKAYELVAVTAAQKMEDGSYDHDTAVDITGSVTGLPEDGSDVSGASVSWTAPAEGEWTIFYLYRQSMETRNTPVVDHFSADATDAVIGFWENTIMSDDTLRGLFEENGGQIFCDSLELGYANKSTAALWTKNLLKEFEVRRGYDLTPYLPALFIVIFYHYQAQAAAHDDGGMSADWDSDFDFGEAGSRVRKDFFETLTELFTENHVEKIAE